MITTLDKKYMQGVNNHSDGFIILNTNVGKILIPGFQLHHGLCLCWQSYVVSWLAQPPYSALIMTQYSGYSWLFKQGWISLSKFPQFRYFPFIFDRCRTSSAALAPVKYTCVWNDLIGIFDKKLLTGKLKSGALATPTPELTTTPSIVN